MPVRRLHVTSSSTLQQLLLLPPRILREGCPELFCDAVQAHSSVRKACMVAVTPHVRVLPTCHSTGFSMEPALLEAAIKEDLAAGEPSILTYDSM